MISARPGFVKPALTYIQGYMITIVISAVPRYIHAANSGLWWRALRWVMATFVVEFVLYECGKCVRSHYRKLVNAKKIKESEADRGINMLKL